jgi:hypothetical protein
MHAWYHEKAIKQVEVSKYCSGIHIHDSFVVIEKQIVHPPVHSRVS